MPAGRGRGDRFWGAPQRVSAASTQTPDSGGCSAALPPGPARAARAPPGPGRSPRPAPCSPRVASRARTPEGGARTPPARPRHPARRLPRTWTGGRGTEPGAKGRALTSGSGAGAGPTSGAGPRQSGGGCGARCSRERVARPPNGRPDSGARSGGTRTAPTSAFNPRGKGGEERPQPPWCRAEPQSRQVHRRALRGHMQVMAAQHDVVWVDVFDRVRSGERNHTVL